MKNQVAVIIDTVTTDANIDRLYNWLKSNLPGDPEIKWPGNRVKNGEFDPAEIQQLLKTQNFDFGNVMFWSVGKGWAYGCPVSHHDKEFVIFSNPVMATKFALEFL